MKFANFKYAAPRSLDEAVQLLAEGHGDAKVIAGGQSLLPTMAFRLAQPAMLVDLKYLSSLRGISLEADHVRIGALSRWRDIQESELIRRELPLMTEAVRHIAHYQIRNRGTIGGSLVHADPAAEMPCVVLTCNATLMVQGPKGKRLIPAAEFFLGSLTTALNEDEILTDILIPRWRAARRWAFKEFSRRAGDFAFAGCVVICDVVDARLQTVGLGAFGVGGTPLRLSKTEGMLQGQPVTRELILAAAKSAGSEIRPLDEPHVSGEYRRALLIDLVNKALTDALLKNPKQDDSEARVR